jgi:hypothetical protein
MRLIVLHEHFERPAFAGLFLPKSEFFQVTYAPVIGSRRKSVPSRPIDPLMKLGRILRALGNVRRGACAIKGAASSE